MELIHKYFPELNALQVSQFEALEGLYKDWNSKINVLSRKDEEQLYERHVLHSLGIARYVSFMEGSSILDVGTGGGFPGIPLAIMFPEVQFHLVDSIGKKIKVVNAVAESLGLKNVKAECIRAEKIRAKYHFIVSRAVTDMTPFYPWVNRLIHPHTRHKVPNGILALKGGDLQGELLSFGENFPLTRHRVFDLSDYFEEAFFETKKLVHAWPIQG